MGIIDFVMLVILAGLWGASFLFIRVAVPAFGPFLLVDMRVLIAALALILFAFATKSSIHILTRWRSYFLLGAINAAIPFIFISIAELHLSAALAAILNATTPMFTAVIARVWLGDKLHVPKVIGLIIGIFGVMMAVSGPSQPGDHGKFLWALCSLLAAVAYGVGGVYSARTFKNERPIDLAIGQQLAAGIILLPFIFLHPTHIRLTTAVTVSVLSLAILSTALGYLLYFQLMRRVGPVRTISVTFLVPIFGLIWGALFLGEPLSWHLLVALFIILGSVLLVTRKKPASKTSTSP